MITWNGTLAEFGALSTAVARACECQKSSDDKTAGRCAAHRMLTDDQRAMDGLLFARRISARLQREEWQATNPEGAPSGATGRA